MHLKLSGKIILRKFLLSRHFLWIWTLALKSPFLGFWILASSILLRWRLVNRRRIISSRSVSISYCSGYEERRIQHFPDFNLESIFIIYMETGVDLCLPNCPLGESPTASHCPVECFLRWKSKSWKTTVWDSNDSNKTGMGFALSRDLFYFGFFVDAAEFRLGFGRC